MVARLMIAALSSNHQETLKDKVYYSQILKGTQQTWGHTVRSQLGLEGWVLLLLEVKGGGLGFHRFTLNS